MHNFAQRLGSIFLIGGISISIFFLIPLIPMVNQWYQLAVVQSASMEPNLKVGSLAIYKAQTAYYPGEVIAYQVQQEDSEKLIIHRIVEKNTQDNQTVYLTQGDATGYLSPNPIFSGQVRGKLIGSIDNFGYVLAWFKSKAGIASVIFVCLVLVIIDNFVKLP